MLRIVSETKRVYMNNKHIPKIVGQLLSAGYIKQTDILQTQDGFWLIYKSLSDILLEKGIVEFPDSEGKRLKCSKFYDDWFLYAVPDEADYTYSLLKFREQEHDTEDGSPADGDTPGVTISFIAFACDALLACLANPSEGNRRTLDGEINRVVARRGQRHHMALKHYFMRAKSAGAYLVAATYIKHIASFSQNGHLDVPEHYKKIVQQSISYKNSARLARLPRFIGGLNRDAGYTVCDNNQIFIRNREVLTEYESAAILATHTGNTSVYSFAAEVEYHAKFLTPLAKIKIPFFGRSIYDSAIRADMTIDDTEFEGPAPFYQADAKIVRRQYALHPDR